MAFERLPIDVALVERLVAAQFPAWAHLPVRQVTPGGNDNRTFRLGEDLLVRLPSHRAYAAGVEKEQRWLPALAAQLPLPIPAPVGLGAPTADYPCLWSIYRWLSGEVAAAQPPDDLVRFAEDLAGFLVALQAIDAEGGPEAGWHSFHRGGALAVYDAQTREAIAALGGSIDGATATAAWETALASAWARPPVWAHGDVAVNNLLVEAGRLSAVIDFGASAVGDLVIAWTLFEGESRAAFRAGLPLDDATWARGRGWALWKALITLATPEGFDPPGQRASAEVLAVVLAEHRGQVRRS
ncbi:MAG: aminoglycoside phosphotransferase family protein [Caulobacteraceae bacterium]|nr:aminoglycoside phosphotransferase family protein [Caulobacteraceae bacterium]